MPEAFAFLQRDVIKKDLCVTCGACAASCTVTHIAIPNELPSPVGICVVCGVCYNVCPQLSFPSDEIEEFLFGRTRKEDEPIGIFRSGYIVRTTRDDVLKVAQDGGAVTSILAHALEAEKIDCAVVTGFERERPWKPKPVVALSYDTLVECAGAKYCTNPMLLGLASAVEEYEMRRVALVGTPCQIRGARKMQTSANPKRPMRLADSIKLTIGLFCEEAYEYDKFNEFMRQRGVRLSKVDHTAIKGGMFRAFSNKRLLLEVPVKEIKSLASPSCQLCTDYTAEFADLSVGGVGVPGEWSMVLARTERGERALLEAERGGYVELSPIEEIKPGLNLVMRIARRKAQQARNKLEEQKSDQSLNRL
ncbi:MAG: Coenzyme F420 hydrogenase/dehydrogenase, beta subunit C-terminal domain [Candidatus Bathyarchaeia archaeon]